MLNQEDNHNDLFQIKKILFKYENFKLQKLNKKVHELSEIVEDKEFIGKQLNASIQENKQAIINSLSPVIGSIIRKSVSESIKQAIKTIDSITNKAFSLQGLRWHFESWNTGTPLPEVILRNTLIYRVEHIFLINRKTSELLNHLVASRALRVDKNSFAGLLNAITDFAHDVFSINNKTGCHSIELGDLNIWVNESPNLYLALVVRGEPPFGLREKIISTSDSIHINSNYKNTELDIKNDPEINEILKPLLEERVKDTGNSSNGKKGLFIFILLSYLFSFFLIRSLINTHQESMRSRELNQYVSQLINDEQSKHKEIQTYMIELNKQKELLSTLHITNSQDNYIQIAESINKLYTLKPETHKIVLFLNYNEVARALALKIARVVNWKLNQMGFLDYHIVRTQLTTNFDQEYNIQLKLISNNH